MSMHDNIFNWAQIQYQHIHSGMDSKMFFPRDFSILCLCQKIFPIDKHPHLQSGHRQNRNQNRLAAHTGKEKLMCMRPFPPPPFLVYTHATGFPAFLMRLLPKHEKKFPIFCQKTLFASQTSINLILFRPLPLRRTAFLESIPFWNGEESCLYKLLGMANWFSNGLEWLLCWSLIHILKYGAVLVDDTFLKRSIICCFWIEYRSELMQVLIRSEIIDIEKSIFNTLTIMNIQCRHYFQSETNCKQFSSKEK